MNVASLAWLFLWILACSARQIPRKEHHLLHQNDHHEKRAQDTQVSSGSDKSDEEEYPILPKRAAMLLDRIMVALHHALEDSEDGKGRKINEVYRDGHYFGTGATSAPPPRPQGKLSKEKFFHQGGSAGAQQNSGYDANLDYYSEEDIDERSVSGEQQEENLLGRENTMDLQRRGHDVSTGSGFGVSGAGKGRVYWRCYFNAVTCF